MKVCLVMVTYNRFDTLMKSIDTIKKQVRPVDYFVVVDNGSTDNTPARLAEGHVPVELVIQENNLGYAAGLARGMEYASGKYKDIAFFWLMDDDSQPQPDALQRLLKIKDTFPFTGILSVTGFIDTIWKGPVRFSNYRRKVTKQVEPSFPLYEVDHALIDGALVDHAVVDNVGVPDGSFFMMCEDVEYCKRMQQAGFRIILLDDEAMMSRLHYGGGGGFSRSNLWRGYYGARNHLYIIKKYFSWRGLLAYVIRQTKYLLAALMAPDRFTRFYLRASGIWHGMIGVRGKTMDPKNY
jgi:GT2 family glycosyltransferase